MDKSEIIEKLLLYKELLKPYFDPHSMFLFGSYATGKQHKDSDIDVAIVVNNLSDDYFSYAAIPWKLRRLVDDCIEPIILQKGKDDSGFLEDVLRNGIEVKAA
jgi:uncharacterized protein